MEKPGRGPVGKTLGQAWILVLLFSIPGCATGSRGIPPSEGIANFKRVDPHLYRGAQPDRAGMQRLHKLGVRTIINLRAPNDTWPDEKQTAMHESMSYFNVPMSGFLRPDAETVSAALAIIEKSPSPVFVHCQYGCDRTGTIIACYRIKHDGWTSDRALDEARAFGMYPWQIGMKNFVRVFEKRARAKLR